MNIRSKVSCGYFVFAVAAAALMLPTSAGAQDGTGSTGKSAAPEASGSIGGRVDKVKYTWADDQVTTTSTTYVNVPEMSRTTRTRRRGPIIVLFCAEAHAPEGEAVWVQVLLNGGSMLPDVPSDNVVYEGDNGFWYQSKCFTWAKKVPAGTYRIQVQYKSPNGGVAGLDQRSMTIFQR